jgi:hypothetical protein
MHVMVLRSIKFKNLNSPTAGRPSNTRRHNVACGVDPSFHSSRIVLRAWLYPDTILQGIINALRTGRSGGVPTE